MKTRTTHGIPATLAARYLLPVVLVLGMVMPSAAGDLDVSVESGAVWFSRNDARIPGDDGTRFNLLNLTDTGPDAYARVNVTYAFNERHAIRLTLAPLKTEGTGTLATETRFDGEVFEAGLPTKGTYQFNTYRLTYRWTVHDSDKWQWGVGAAALVRDADIALQQGLRKASRDDLGLVPLLHGYGAYRANDHVSVVVDAEGAWSPMGRAFDVALKGEYAFDSGWYVAAGYRTLEGGADNDEVYTFSWLHFALTEVGYRF